MFRVTSVNLYRLPAGGVGGERNLSWCVQVQPEASVCFTVDDQNPDPQRNVSEMFQQLQFLTFLLRL